MKTRAAIAWEAKKPLAIETVDLEGPKAGEVLVEVKATGICHTDAYTLSGPIRKGNFPRSSATRAPASCARSAPASRRSSPATTSSRSTRPSAAQCKSCLSRRDQSVHRDPRDPGPGRDARRHQPLLAARASALLHYMGCSTFANFTVLPEIAVARVRADAPFDKICYIGCGVTTGIGAVIFTAKVWPGANVVVFGLGGIGLNVIQGARMVGADTHHRRRHQSGQGRHRARNSA